MPALEITIINKLGLHARAAAKFVGVAGATLARSGSAAILKAASTARASWP